MNGIQFVEIILDEEVITTLDVLDIVRITSNNNKILIENVDGLFFETESIEFL